MTSSNKLIRRSGGIFVDVPVVMLPKYLLSPNSSIGSLLELPFWPSILSTLSVFSNWCTGTYWFPIVAICCKIGSGGIAITCFYSVFGF